MRVKVKAPKELGWLIAFSKKLDVKIDVLDVANAILDDAYSVVIDNGSEVEVNVDNELLELLYPRIVERLLEEDLIDAPNIQLLVDITNMLYNMVIFSITHYGVEYFDHYVDGYFYGVEYGKFKGYEKA